MYSRTYREWKRDNRKRKRIRKKKTFPIIWFAIMLLIGILIGGTVVFFALQREATNRKPELLSGLIKFRIEIHEEEYEELVAEHSIDNPSSPEDRNVNLARAGEILNGHRINPGEKFSWIEVVGNPTIERGFKEAGEIAEGKGTKGIGGGVCQVSSTINTAIQKTEQSLDIECFHAERHSTEEPPAYLKPERGDKEASVAFTSQKDFWFVSTLGYPIRFGIETNQGEVSVKIFAIRTKYLIVIKQVSD